MKIVCPLCGKKLPRFENILIHLNRVHPELTQEKALDLALGAKITDVSRKGDKKVISTLKREKSVLLGKKLSYKKMKPHSIYWGQLSRPLVGQNNCYLDFCLF